MLEKDIEMIKTKMKFQNLLKDRKRKIRDLNKTQNDSISDNLSFFYSEEKNQEQSKAILEV